MNEKTCRRRINSSLIFEQVDNSDDVINTNDKSAELNSRSHAAKQIGNVIANY